MGPAMRESSVVVRGRERQEWQFLAALRRAAPGLAAAWWTLLVLRGLAPVALAIAIATGVLVGAVERQDPLAGALAFVGVVFVVFQVLTPLHQAVGANVGSRLAAWLNDRLMVATTTPPGIGHLERAALIAALDAETEHARFERYAVASREEVPENGRITILVSHRFSTVRMAGLIVVMDGARVVEVGSHDELMARAGRYADLFTIQAAAYR